MSIYLLRYINIVTNSSDGTADINYYSDTVIIKKDIGLPSGESIYEDGYNENKTIVSVLSVGRNHRFGINTVTGTSKPKVNLMGIIAKPYRSDNVDISYLTNNEHDPYLEISNGYYLEISSGYRLIIS